MSDEEEYVWVAALYVTKNQIDYAQILANPKLPLEHNRNHSSHFSFVLDHGIDFRVEETPQDEDSLKLAKIFPNPNNLSLIQVKLSVADAVQHHLTISAAS